MNSRITQVRTIIYPMSSPVSVQALTALLPLTSFGERYKSILIAVLNLSNTETMTAIVDTGEDPTISDDELEQTKSAGPRKQASFEIGPDALRTYYGISAKNADALGPAFNVQWIVRGLNRVSPMF